MTTRTAAGTWQPSRRGTMAVVGLAGLTAVALVILNAAMPYLVRRSTLMSEIAAQVRATAGLAVVTRQARFDLLPLPRVTLLDARVTDPSGGFDITAERIQGDVRLLPLLVGRIELAAVRLEKARVTVDLDAADALLARTFDRDKRSSDDDIRRLGALTLADSTLELARASRPVSPPLSIGTATLDWRAVDAPATINAAFVAGDATVDLAAWVANPGGLARREHSAVALRLHSGAGDLSTNGDLWVSGPTGAVPRTNFKGRAVAAAPSLAALAEPFGADVVLPAPFADIKLAANAVVALDREGVAALDLADLDLRADGNAFEGTLAYLGGAKPLVSGTLATTFFSLDPVLKALPAATQAGDCWSERHIPAFRFGDADLDLRISAARLRVAWLTLDDAALSVMTRGDRIEIGLSEGKAYGGVVKGRASLGRLGEDVSLRAAGTLTGADLAGLSWDAAGRQLATGFLSLSASVESNGDSAAALAHHLQGWAKGSAVNGELSRIDLGDSLRATEPNRPFAARNGRTPFSAVSLGLRLLDGQGSLEDGRWQGPGPGPDATTARLLGTIDIGARRLDIGAVVLAPSLIERRVTVKGGFDGATLVVDGAAASPEPGRLSLP